MARWMIDSDHTVAHFTARHMMITFVHGQFNRITGVIDFDSADLSKTAAEIEIDAAVIYTGVEARDRHLRSEDFLDVERHPAITLRSTGAECAGSNLFKLYGDLTIRGVTRPVLLHAASFGPNEYADETGSYTVMGFEARVSLNREDFGITWNNVFGKNQFMVGKHLDIVINVEADLQSP
jgi:polyisoprenoid-binding protein YceI